MTLILLNKMTEEKIQEKYYKNYLSENVRPFGEDKLPLINKSKPYLERLIKKYFPSDTQANVLDLACGYGALLYIAKQQGYQNLSGVDSSELQVQSAHQLGLSMVKLDDVFVALKELPESSQDVVVSMNFVEHLKKNKIVELAEEVYRVLKQKGKWIIHVPNAE